MDPLISLLTTRSRVIEVLVLASDQRFLCPSVCVGFPPKEINFDGPSSITGIIKNGDTINVTKSDAPLQMTLENAVTSSTTSQLTASPLAAPSNSETKPMEDIPQEILDVIANDKPKRPTAEDLDGFESQSDYGAIVRRVMPDDNSCLFHTIAYVLEGEKVASQATLTRLRRLVSKTIQEDNGFQYDAATLAKSPSEYARWILQPNSWGGAIELSIFAQAYSTEIFALDVINGIGNCFGENDGYGKRVYVIFDGIHYDAIAISPIEEEKELDLVEFKPWDQPVEKMALDYLRKEKRAGNYTDTQKFQILCQQCQTILVGEKGAAMHAMTTGHSQFVEKR